MNDLRQAAEMALKYFEDAYGLEDTEVAIKEALRQALAEEALDRMAAENQRLGLYDEDNLQTAIEKGTKAWADVPNATEWVEELRGEDTPEVTPEVPCKTHPDAPHGFDRNASHSADRYVCECEGWEPVDKAYTKNDTTAGVLHKEWVGLTDEEVKYLTSHFDWRAPKEQFVPVIEAKLKEKNSGN